MFKMSSGNILSCNSYSRSSVRGQMVVAMAAAAMKVWFQMEQHPLLSVLETDNLNVCFRGIWQKPDTTGINSECDTYLSQQIDTHGLTWKWQRTPAYTEGSTESSAVLSQPQNLDATSHRVKSLNIFRAVISLIFMCILYLKSIMWTCISSFKPCN